MSSIWAKGCMLMIVCVLSDLTDNPWCALSPLVEGESHGVLFLYH